MKILGKILGTDKLSEIEIENGKIKKISDFNGKI